MKISGIILAAGASTRMTKYKQLLRFKGESLLKAIVDKCQQLELNEIVCITGYLDHELKAEAMNEDITFIHNTKHKEGMVGSLQLGINHVNESSADAALVLLTDQPLIPLSHYQSMISTLVEHKAQLVATSYNEIIGVPAIYTRQYFQEIMALDNNSSAKSILIRHRKDMLTIDCALAGIDVDTDEDYQKLLDQYE